MTMGSNQVCPHCRTQGALPVKYTWWGGLLGPKMFNLVKCTGCKRCYNGKTGKSADLAIGLYIGISFVFFAILGYVMFGFLSGRL